MEKFNYYFNTRSRIDAALSVPINKSTMESILFNLIWDAYYNVSHDEQEILQYIDIWMNGKTTIYHLSSYAKTIKNYIKKMKKMPWRDIKDTVKILIIDILKLQRKELKIKNNTIGFFYNNVFLERIESAFY